MGLEHVFLQTVAFILCRMISHNDSGSCPVLSTSHSLSAQLHHQIRKMSRDTQVNYGRMLIFYRDYYLCFFPKDLNSRFLFCSRARIYQKSLGFKAALEMHHLLVLFIYIFRGILLWLLEYHLIMTCRAPECRGLSYYGVGSVLWFHILIKHHL